MSTQHFLSGSILLGVLAISAPMLGGCHTSTSASSQISDSSITASVKSKMIGDSKVAAHNIDVNTEEGVVYLLGRVSTESEKSEAERIARSCEGVRDVVNHLKVGETS
jgi:hyperosmotically inducible protein